MKYLKKFESSEEENPERQYYIIPVKGAIIAMKKIGLDKFDISRILDRYDELSDKFKDQTKFYIDNEENYWSGPYTVNTHNENYYINCKDYTFTFMGNVEVDDYEIDAELYNL